MRRPGLLVPFLCTVACSPAAGHHAQQTIAGNSTPVSEQELIVGCVDAVLANSPLVKRVTTPRSGDNPRARGIVLRNPPSPRTTGLGFAIVPAHGAPRQLVVEFSWPGRWQGEGGMKPPPQDPQASAIEGETLRDVAATLLRDMHAQCAPAAPGEPTCTRVAQGQRGRCVLAT